MTSAPLRAERVGRSVGAGGSGFRLEIERFEVAAGERVAVVGPSGCGKSTLLAVLGLALEPGTGGVLALGGTDALALWRGDDGDGLAALRARCVGFVPQTGALLPFLSLRENIALPGRIGGRGEAGRVTRLAERLGIAGVLERRPGAVSVGQRQRAAIARALAHRPGVVLADEPTASVHPAQADKILTLLAEAAREDGAALVISTHDWVRAEGAGFGIAPGQGVGRNATRFCWPP